MKTLKNLLLMSMLIFSSTSAVLACMWDYDTIAMERERFPEALELITGKFLRHSKEFYEWRIKDRLEKLKVEKKAEWMDDLGVAYDKTGQHDLAIDLMLEKEQLFPGLYETQANLGTFYIHGGMLTEGLQHLENAIKINPHAHFDREVYQIQLVKYVLSKQVDGKTILPLCPEVLPHDYGFSGHLIQAGIVSESSEQKDEDLKQAIKGVLGMMRFGNHESPILLEVLADLLISLNWRDDGKRLGSRAYLQASYQVQDEQVKKEYFNKANFTARRQTVNNHTEEKLTIEELEKVFHAELEQAKTWFAEVENDEKEWIAQGLNADESFSKKYYREPEVATAPEPEVPFYKNKRSSFNRYMPLIISSCFVITGYLLIKFFLWQLRMVK